MNSQASTAIVPQGQSIFERLTIFDIYEIVTGREARTNNSGHGNFMVRCPVAKHEDQDPSCSISEDKNGVFHCFSCGQKGGKYKLCIVAGKATDVRSAAKFLEEHAKLPRINLEKQPAVSRAFGGGVQLINPRTTGVYPYLDENGKELYRIIRRDGESPEPDGRTKDFTMKFPQADGRLGSIAGPENMRRIPYRLPELIKNNQSEHPASVLVWEGEGKADLAAAMGFISTSSPNGTHWAWPIAWLRFFDKAPYIFVMADSDAPGRQAAQTKATLLARADRPAIVIDFFPDRTEGEDLKEWRAELFDLGFTDDQISQELRTKLKRAAKNYILPRV